MDAVNIIGALLASVVLITMAIFVLFKDWKDSINRYFVVYNLGGFGILFTMFLIYAFPESKHLTEINKYTMMSTLICFSGFFALSFAFPKSEDQIPFKKIVLLMIPAFVIAAIVVTTDLAIAKAHFQDGKFLRELKTFYKVYSIVTFLYLISGVINFIRKYLKTKIDIYKLQMRYVFLGTSIGLVIGAVCSIVLPLVFNYTKLYVLGPIIASVIAAVTLFYSVIALSMMDIKTAAHKTVMYSIISALIIIPIWGVIFLYTNIPELGKIPLYMLALFIITGFILFSIYLQPIIDKTFKRKLYEFENIVDSFIRSVKTDDNSGMIIQQAVDILYTSLFLERAFFVMYNHDSRSYELNYSKGLDAKFAFEAIDVNSTIIRWFVRNSELLTEERLYIDDKFFGDAKDDLIKFYSDNSIKIIIPLYFEKRVQGLYCLGSKDTLAAFTTEELEKLSYFQNESSEFISTAISYQKAGKEQLVSRTIDLSSEISLKSIPEYLPNVKGIKFGAFVIPRFEQGVDYFDFIRPSTKGIGVIATDVSGVGVNNSLSSVVMRSSFHASIADSVVTNTMMQNLNNVLYRYTEGKGGLTTAYYFYFDMKNMRLMYTNAGFPPLEIYRIEKGGFDSYDTQGIPLGYEKDSSFGVGRTDLLRGDIGTLFSKSLINTRNQKGESYGLIRLRNVIKENRSKKPVDIAESINRSYKDFIGLASPGSDVLALVFKIG